MSIIDIPEGFHDPDAWLAEQRAEEAETGAELLADYTGPTVSVDQHGAYRATAGSVRNRTQRGAA